MLTKSEKGQDNTDHDDQPNKVNYAFIVISSSLSQRNNATSQPFVPPLTPREPPTSLGVLPTSTERQRQEWSRHQCEK